VWLREIRRSVHGPVVAEHGGKPVALKVSSIDRPGLFEQFWKMGLSQNLEEWLAAMRTCSGEYVYITKATICTWFWV